jgi:hypothetical protein
LPAGARERTGKEECKGDGASDIDADELRSNRILNSCAN